MIVFCLSWINLCSFHSWIHMYYLAILDFSGVISITWTGNPWHGLGCARRVCMERPLFSHTLRSRKHNLPLSLPNQVILIRFTLASHVIQTLLYHTNLHKPLTSMWLHFCAWYQRYFPSVSQFSSTRSTFYFVLFHFVEKLLSIDSRLRV